MLEHGGRIGQAALHYHIPVADWLDLSTGINPHGWPVPALSPRLWNRLPEDEDELVAVACANYGCRSLLPVAGSQAAIQVLPRLRPPCRVGVVAPVYGEHPKAWREAGHQLFLTAPHEVAEHLAQWQVLVVVNPNNPTGHRWSAGQLLSWHEKLAERGGWLVVDEAFMDADPTDSLAGMSQRPGLLVLRSLGKFYGLAGARVGFLLAESRILAQVAAMLGPWGVANPARWVASRALADLAWQQQTRTRLQQEAPRLAALLTHHGLPPAGGTALFQWVCHGGARQVQERLARQGVWLRAFDHPASLRCGLPASEEEWQRLEWALSH